MSPTPKIGLDKLVLTNFTMHSIDHDHLHALAYHSKQDGVLCHTYPNDAGQWHAKIADNKVFADLSIGVGQYNTYAIITLSPTHVCGDNCDNLTIAKYNDYFVDMLTYIASEYHIVLTMEQIKVKGMEINCNILLEGTYSQYARVHRLLMSFCPHTLNIEETCCDRYQGRARSTTFTRRNGSWGIVIYNKTAQMQRKLPAAERQRQIEAGEPEIMRVEVRLYSARKIKDVFKSNAWHDLDDCKIRDYYHRVVTSQWELKYGNWRDKQYKALKRLIKKLRKAHKTNWHHALLHYANNRSIDDLVPYMLDIAQAQHAYQYLPDQHRNSGRTRATMANAGFPDDVYHRDDLKKITNILRCLAASQSDAERK